MRLDYARLFPDAVTALGRLEQVVHDSGLDPRLLELVKSGFGCQPGVDPLD